MGADKKPEVGAVTRLLLEYGAVSKGKGEICGGESAKCRLWKRASVVLVAVVDVPLLALDLAIFCE